MRFRFDRIRKLTEDYIKKFQFIHSKMLFNSKEKKRYRQLFYYMINFLLHSVILTKNIYFKSILNITTNNSYSCCNFYFGAIVQKDSSDIIDYTTLNGFQIYILIITN